MRYPNRRYGNPAEMAHYALGYSSITALSRSLRRDERTVKDWISGKKKVPFWVPELLRLRHMEACEINRQMRIYGPKALLGVVRGDVIELAAQPGQHVKKPQPMTALRLDDFRPDCATSRPGDPFGETINSGAPLAHKAQ